MEQVAPEAMPKEQVPALPLAMLDIGPQAAGVTGVTGVTGTTTSAVHCWNPAHAPLTQEIGEPDTEKPVLQPMLQVAPEAMPKAQVPVLPLVMPMLIGPHAAGVTGRVGVTGATTTGASHTNDTV
jgi:hypothetical protein